MMVECVRNERDSDRWGFLLLIFFLNAPAALIYFFVRHLPRLQGVSSPSILSRYTRKQDLWNAEAAARNIGKDHQYVELGNVLYDMRMLDRAAEAYATAHEKNSENTQALWGLAQVEIDRKNLTAAKDHLELLLKFDPEYKFGDASADYGKVLYQLEELEAAKRHLDQHVRRWTSAESRLILADIAIQMEQPESAREYLEALLSGLRGGPQFHYRNNRHLVRKAERMLRSLS